MDHVGRGEQKARRELSRLRLPTNQDYHVDPANQYVCRQPRQGFCSIISFGANPPASRIHPIEIPLIQRYPLPHVCRPISQDENAEAYT